MDAKKPYAVAYWYPWSDKARNEDAGSCEGAVFATKEDLDKFLKDAVGASDDGLDDDINGTFVIVFDKPKVFQVAATLVEVS